MCGFKECGDTRREDAPQKIAANRLLSMKHPAASGWLPSKWPDAMHVHTLQAVSVVVMLIALTFIFIGMMPSNGVRHVRVALPSNIPSNDIPSSIVAAINPKQHCCSHQYFLVPNQNKRSPSLVSSSVTSDHPEDLAV